MTRITGKVVCILIFFVQFEYLSAQPSSDVLRLGVSPGLGGSSGYFAWFADFNVGVCPIERLEIGGDIISFVQHFSSSGLIGRVNYMIATDKQSRVYIGAVAANINDYALYGGQMRLNIFVSKIFTFDVRGDYLVSAKYGGQVVLIAIGLSYYPIN